MPFVKDDRERFSVVDPERGISLRRLRERFRDEGLEPVNGCPGLHARGYELSVGRKTTLVWMSQITENRRSKDRFPDGIAEYIVGDRAWRENRAAFFGMTLDKFSGLLIEAVRALNRGWPNFRHVGFVDAIDDLAQRQRDADDRSEKRAPS